MIVVSDTSSICYLILIGEVEVLPLLFGRVIIPPSVRDELTAPGAPEEVRAWIDSSPEWLEVQPVRSVPSSITPGLHAGERDVLALANELGADLVILDDGAARKKAADLGLSFTGLLGILDRAARKQLIDLKRAIRRLRKTSFRIAPALLHRLLVRHVEG